MKCIAPWFAAVVLLPAIGSFAQAQVKDPADLLPASTLACIEFRHPDKLSREASLLIKGSCLEDLAATMAKFRTKLGNEERWWGFHQIAEMGMFVSPEMLSEFSRFQGGMFALTGVSKDKGPQWTGVLLSGESNFPGLFMRAMLTMDDDMRTVGETEGVMVYRQRHRVFQPVQPGQPQAVQREDGFATAMMPGMLIFGSSPEQVQAVILRVKGKSSEPALTSMRAFRETAKLRERPGLFAYSDLEALAGQMDDALKALGAQERAQWEMFKTVVNPRAFRAATASLTVLNGNIELQAQVKTLPGQTSPLLELLPNKKPDVQLLHHVPRDAVATMNLGLGEGEKRWANLVALIDALAKNAGESDLNLPSKKIKEMQDEFRIDFGKDVLAKIKAAAVCAVPERHDLVPLVVLQANDAATAKLLTEMTMPKLAILAGKEGATPKKQELDGVVLYSLPAPIPTGGNRPLVYGSQGDTIVLGIEPTSVAASLKGGSKKEGLLSEAKYATALKDVDGSITVGIGSLSTAIMAVFKAQESHGGPLVAQPVPPPGGAPAQPPPAPKLGDRAEKAIKEMTKHVEPLPPMVFSLNRKDDAIVLEARQLGLRTVATKVIDLWIESALERQAEQMGRNFAKPAPLAPPPPAPPKEEKKTPETLPAKDAKKAPEKEKPKDKQQ